MKYKYLLVCCLFSSVFFAQKKKVEILFYFTEPYCGGARPSEEMEQAATSKQAYANKTIVYRSHRGKVDSAQTNDLGLLKLRLRKGTYFFYEQWRYNLYTPNNLPIENFDKTCLRSEWEKIAFKVSVERKKNTVIEITPIIKLCDWQLPCLTEGQWQIPP